MFIDLTLTLALDRATYDKLDRESGGLFALGHVGTHLDKHSKIPLALDWMDRQGLLLDARGSWDIHREILADVQIHPGAFVLFHTGHLELHGYGTDAYFHDHPHLDWDLVEALLERQVSLIGIDAPGLRRGRQEHARVDGLCEARGAYVIENLARLGELAQRGQTRFPLRLGWIERQGGSGIPVQVVAQVPA